MSDQPKALRLADHLEDQGYYLDHDAAAELRRLHEVNAELVEALKTFVANFDDGEPLTYEDLDKAYAALAKATGEQQ